MATTAAAEMAKARARRARCSCPRSRARTATLCVQRAQRKRQLTRSFARIYRIRTSPAVRVSALLSRLSFAFAQPGDTLPDVVLFEGTPNYGKANEARAAAAAMHRRLPRARAYAIARVWRRTLPLTLLRGAARAPPQLRLRDVFKGKKGILMAVPGAFTPGCSKARTHTHSHTHTHRGATNAS